MIIPEKMKTKYTTYLHRVFFLYNIKYLHTVRNRYKMSKGKKLSSSIRIKV